jgi:hypothetical protein
VDIQLPLWRRSVYVGIFWALWSFSLYTLFFISWYGFLLPAGVALIFNKYWIKKNKLAVFPQWVYASLLYDIFVRRINGNKSLELSRKRSLYALVFGCIFLGLAYGNPVLNLDDMVVVRASYDSFQKLHGRKTCGEMVLSFRLEDGRLVKFYDSMLPDTPRFKELENTKGEFLSIWEYPTTRSPIPACRKYPEIAQIQGTGFQRLYNKERRESLHLMVSFLSFVAFALGIASLISLAVDQLQKTDNMPQPPIDEE